MRGAPSVVPCHGAHLVPHAVHRVHVGDAHQRVRLLWLCVQRILYDNTVVIGRRENGQVEWNTKFLDFAQHYGLQPRVHRPQRPQTMGTVKRPMDYIKGIFFQGLLLNNIHDVSTQARTWLDQAANVRVHGTTTEVPLSPWRKTERAALQSVTAPPYDARS